MKFLNLLYFLLISCFCFSQQINQYYSQCAESELNACAEEKNVFFKKDFKKEQISTWKWDTIVVFDTLHQNKYRTIQTYDNRGNILQNFNQQWQDSVWVNYSDRYSYVYDLHNNLLVSTTEKWINNAWSNYIRQSNTYSSNDSILIYLLERWKNNAWCFSTRMSYTRDSNMNLLCMLREQWDTIAGWVNFYRYNYTYDINNNRLVKTQENWYDSLWRYISRYSCTYDSSNNMLSNLDEIYTSGFWQNRVRNLFTYDSLGKNLTHIRLTWSSNDSSWWSHPGSRETFVYDLSGNVISRITESYRPIEQDWILSGKFDYTYNSHGNKLTYAILSWSQQDSLWVNINKHLYSYNSNNFMLTEALQQWYGYWDNVWQKTYIYDSNDNLVNSISQVYDNCGCADNYIITYTYDGNNNSVTGHADWLEYGVLWRPLTISLGLYSNSENIGGTYGHYYIASYTSLVDVPEIETDLNIIIFPNPAHDKIFITNTNIAKITFVNVYDMQGNLILNEKFENGNNIELNVSKLSKGIYLLKYQSDNSFTVKKMMIQ